MAFLRVRAALNRAQDFAGLEADQAREVEVGISTNGQELACEETESR